MGILGIWGSIVLDDRKGSALHSKLTVKPKVVFRYPTSEDLRGVTATLFNESHPDLWNQRLMSEVIASAVPYAFDILYELRGEDWYRSEQGSEGGTEVEPKYEEGVMTCRECMTPGSDAKVKCPACEWGWYCSEECRKAEVVFSGGQRRHCNVKY